MQIQNDNSTIFQSRIRFVSPEFFRNKTKKMIKNPACENIAFWNISPKQSGKTFCGYRRNVELGYTKNIRTCTAGLVINTGEKAPLFMHIFNSAKNSKNAINLKDYFQGTNAILIGSKNQFPFSKVIFEKFKRYAQNKRIPLTFMQGLNLSWQASIAYEAANDTLFLCVNNARNPAEYVHNKKMLQKVFKKIAISPTDSLEFLSKLREKLIMLGILSE